MKIIEALKRIKKNKETISEQQKLIDKHCAHLSYETPEYGAETKAKIMQWAQSNHDLGLENIRLLAAVSKTNLQTLVTVAIDGRGVTKSVAEWIWRRREYSALDRETWGKMHDRGLKDGQTQSPTGIVTTISVVRNFDPELRDKQLEMLRNEPHDIDSALEIVNAVTDLIE